MKKNDILVILIPSLLIVVLWVVFNIYHNFVTSTIPTTLNVRIQPINPDFDTKAIENIRQRSEIVPIYEVSGQVVTETSPTENISTTPSPAQEASGGGSLLQ